MPIKFLIRVAGEGNVFVPVSTGEADARGSSYVPDLYLPYFIAYLRTLWRIYLNPDCTYDDYRAFVRSEVAVARQEVGRLADAFKSRFLSQVAADWEHGSVGLARKTREGKVQFPMLDRVRRHMMRRGHALLRPEEEVEFVKYLSRKSRGFERILAIFERARTSPPDFSATRNPELLRRAWWSLQRAVQTFHIKSAALSPGLIASARDISAEYLEWITRHPDTLHRIAWQAFEKIVAEVFASHGFTVDFSARTRNRSADLIALRHDEFGVEHRYLVECKRYNHSKVVGLDVVNAVLGAARRANVDHAFLVTTSSFSREVMALESDLRDVRLHLRNGCAVREWLADYRSSHGRLWIAPDLDVF